MTLAEIEERIVSLSPRERLELAAFLIDLECQDEGSFRQVVDQRMQEMDAGNKVTQKEFESTHARLMRQGI